MLQVFLVIFMLIQQTFQNLTSNCGYNQHCSCIQFQTVECDNFNKFENIKLLTIPQQKKLILKPIHLTDLDDRLKLNNFNNNADAFELVFYKINKINISSSFFRSIKNLKKISFFDSKLNFVDRARLCGGEMGIFANLSLELLYFDNVEFENRLCSGMFAGTNISKLEFKDSNFNDAFGSAHEQRGINKLNFDFNIRVISLIIENNEELLKDTNKNFFKHTHTLVLRQPKLKSISDEYFKSFESIRILQLYNSDLKRIFNVSTKWLKWLNPNNHFPLDDPKFEIKHFEHHLDFQVLTAKNVDFSEKSFCNFEYFPHNQLVFFSRENIQNEAKECTCTIYWLYKYYNLYSNLQLNPQLLPMKCLNVKDLKDRINLCNLDKRVSQCPGHLNEIKERALNVETHVAEYKNPTARALNSAKKVKSFQNLLFILIIIILVN